VRKSDTAVAFYEVIEAEAKVVRMVFETILSSDSVSTPLLVY
jgi:hypothetical protein